MHCSSFNIENKLNIGAKDVLESLLSVCMNKNSNQLLITVYPDDTHRLLLHNLLQQQKSVINHAKLQLQRNVQQAWLQMT